MYNRNVRYKKSTVRNCTVVKMESKVGIEKEVDALGRIVIPKDIRERFGIDKRVEIILVVFSYVHRRLDPCRRLGADRVGRQITVTKPDYKYSPRQYRNIVEDFAQPFRYFLLYVEQLLLR